VAAFPPQPFQGEVLKIEPQAQTEQNVTMFPVLVRIDNRQGLLRPGMNAEVEIHVGEREGVLTVPNAALRTQRDVGSAAQVLGLDPTQVQRELAEGQASLGGAAGGSNRAGGDSTRGDSVRVAATGTGGRPQRQRMRAGGPRSSGAFGGRYIVFVKRPEGPKPVWVQTGLTDGDRSEVVNGLQPTDSVLILPSQSLVQSQEEARERMNRITGGGGLPGVQQQQQGTGGSGAQRAPAGGVR
jgi:HlyD family secretion protein